MRFFRKGDDEFEIRLRDARPEPPAELVSEIARKLQTASPRRSPGLRLALATGLTLALLATFASVGGVGYASAAASKAATAVSEAAGTVSKTGKDATKRDSHAKAAPSKSAHPAKANVHPQTAHDPHDPGHDQYEHFRLPVCHRAHTLLLPSPAANAHLARHPHDTAGPCRA